MHARTQGLGPPARPRRAGRGRLRWRQRQHRGQRHSGEPRRGPALARRLRRAEGRLRQGHPALPADARGARASVSASPTARPATSRARSRPACKTDFVNFSVEPDVTRLVDAGLVDASWNADEHKGIPFGSVVTHRRPQGQPQGHQGLGRPAQARRRGRHAEPVLLGLGEVEPARPVRRQERRRQGPRGRPRLPRPSWSATTSRSSRSPAARRPRRSSRARATCCSATRTRRCSPSATARPVEHHNAAARPSRSRTRSRCSTRARTRRRRRRSTTSSTPPRASARGPRPASARSTRRSRKEFADDFPAPEKLWTIADLGGWDKVNAELFEPETGSVAKIYDEATN